MSTATEFRNIDWTASLAGSDPYLIWASLSELRNFRVRGDKYQVAVETPNATNPLPKVGTSTLGLREVCASGDGGGKFFVGTVNEKQLIELAEQTDIKLEFNLARQQDGGQTGGGLQFAIQPKLGKSVVAVVDFGCPFAHQQFLTKSNDNLSSRVRYLWDQEPLQTVIAVSAPAGLGADGSWWYPVANYQYGRELTSPVMETLFAACSHAGVLDEDKVYSSIANSTENSALDARATHGSHVLDLAAGRLNPMASSAYPAIDAASAADIIFVQLPRDTVADTSGGSMTMYALDALTYIFEKTADVNNLVINISYGSTAGPHDGSSMLERAMDCLIASEHSKRKGKNIKVVLPTGNHFLAQGHGRLTLNQQTPQSALNWQVMPDDATDTFVELWYKANVANPLEVILHSPCGRSRISAKLDNFDVMRNAVGKAVGAIVHSANTPNGESAMALIALAPTHVNRAPHVEHGVWKIEIKLTAATQSDITVDAWIERDDSLLGQQGQLQSFFLSTSTERLIDSPDSAADPVKRQTTGNSLANGAQPIVVGGYVLDSFAPGATTTPFELSAYSAAGPTLNPARADWPNYVAPSDESASCTGLLAAGTRSGVLIRMNGTSVAAPQLARQLLNIWNATPAAPAAPVMVPVAAAVPVPVRDIRDQRGIGARVL